MTKDQILQQFLKYRPEYKSITFNDKHQDVEFEKTSQPGAFFFLAEVFMLLSMEEQIVLSNLRMLLILNHHTPELNNPHNAN